MSETKNGSLGLYGAEYSKCNPVMSLRHWALKG